MPFRSKPKPNAAADSTPSPPRVKVETLYETLGVTQSATTAEITTAYRKLALMHHPDRPDGSKGKFQELNSAYEMLSNPINRSKYDALLKGMPPLKSFKRPAKMERVEKPVYTLLADLAFYEFEGASSKLRCSFHYGDGIEFNGERGSFIGLAGDGNLYWSVNGRGYATVLCKADSDMALSNVRVVYRSNMGLRRKPLERSRAGNYISPLQQQQRGATRFAASSAQSGRSGSASRLTSDGSPRMSEAERIREQLRNKERHRSAMKRLEALEKSETEERNYLERKLWDNFCTLHTNLEAGIRCVTRGMPVTAELAMFMGYVSPAELPLATPVPGNLMAMSAHDSFQTAALWVDPLADDSEGEEQGYNNHSAASLNGDANGEEGTLLQPPQQRQQSFSSSPSSTPSRSVSDFDTTSSSDAHRSPLTAGQELLNPTGFIVTYVSGQPSTSSAKVFSAPRPTASVSSSLGNGHQQPSPAPPSHPGSVSWVSSPAVYGSPAPTMTSHGLAADTRPAIAPHAIHNVQHDSNTIMQHTSGIQRSSLPTTTMDTAAVSVGRENESFGEAMGMQEVSRASRESLQEMKQPALLPVSITLPTNDATQSYNVAPPPNTNKNTTEHVIALQPAKGESAGIYGDKTSAPRNNSSDNIMKSGETMSPRPLYPWSAEHSPQRDSLARTTLREAIPDLAVRGAAEAKRSYDASPPSGFLSSSEVTQTNSNLRGSTGIPAAKGAPGDGGASPSSRSPQTQNERTSAPNSQGRPPRSSPSQEKSPRTLSYSHTANGEGPRTVKFRNSTVQVGIPTPAAAAPTLEIDTSALPWLVMTGGGSSGMQSSSSHGGSGGTINQSLEEGLRTSTQRISQTPMPATGGGGAGFFVGSRDSHDISNHQHYVDIAQGSSLSSLPGSACGVRASNDAGAPSSTSPGDVSGPRITMAPLRLSAAHNDGLPHSVQDAELDAPPLSPGAAAALERKKRMKGRVAPRYMLATEAHSRRISGLPSELTGASGQTPSPWLESIHAYSSMTAEEMLAEEEGFMSAFAQTKRAI